MYKNMVNFMNMGLHKFHFTKLESPLSQRCSMPKFDRNVS